MLVFKQLFTFFKGVSDNNYKHSYLLLKIFTNPKKFYKNERETKKCFKRQKSFYRSNLPTINWAPY